MVTVGTNDKEVLFNYRCDFHFYIFTLSSIVFRDIFNTMNEHNFNYSTLSAKMHLLFYLKDSNIDKDVITVSPISLHYNNVNG